MKSTARGTGVRFAGSMAVIAALVVAAGPAAAAVTARQVLDASGVAGGLVVHVGCGDGRLTAELHAGEGYLIHGLDTEAKNVAAARKHIASKGLYGKVSAARFDGKALPYIDNLVNLVVAEDLGDVPMAEVMRALAPLGVAYSRQGGKWTRTVKPWPREIDEWPQYLHGADNNAVAHDSAVGPPRHMQWTSGPVWSRSHMAISTVVAMVSSHGRLFTIEDAATPENPFLPGRFRLVARGAFNGVELWQHDFPDWEPVTRYIKDIAIQLQRRVAAIGDTVYCTPGLSAPLTAYDAATGKVIRVYKGTRRTQEFAVHGGVLYAVVGDRMNSARYNIVKAYGGKGINLGGSDPKAPFGGTGFRGAYTPETPDKEDPTCRILAIEAKSGKELWRTKPLVNYVACTLALRGDYAVYQTAQGMTCVKPKSGAKIWRVDKAIAGGDGTEANTLILTDTMVYAQEGKAVHAYSLADGSHKWQGPIVNNYEKSADLFYAAGAVWTGGSKQPTSFDPLTGEKINTIRQGMNGPMGHDRCYRNLITDRFYINSKTGGADFLSLADKTEFPNHWVRGTCGMSVLPCNGMLYAPPWSCQCSIGAMIPNFNALYTEKGLKSSGQMVQVKRRARLEKGPAFGQIGNRKSKIGNSDWPTYRHDPTRGGATRSAVPTKLKIVWQVKVTTVPSAPVVAAGKLFVADVDAHTLCAFNVADGSPAWTYVTGGRVDSPPTIHDGLVLFGSRDGWVYCLRAADGELAWRFRDLPDKTICAFGQLESAWPVSGSVLVKGGLAYFAAGRSSYLDGGIFLYAVNPQTGKVVHSRQIHGPYDARTGFPAVDTQGFKTDIIVADAKRLYMRHKAFNGDLTDAGAAAPHVIPSAGFVDAEPQHRTYWTVASRFSGKTGVRGASGDILVLDGKTFYEVRGFPTTRHSYFDPRVKGYELRAATVGSLSPTPAKGAGARRRGGGGRRSAPTAKWTADIPLTGQAMALAGKTVFVAGTPAYFPPDHAVAQYEAAYAGKLGGVLWAASTVNGKKLAEFKLPAAPRWDGLAVANGKLFIALKDGTVACMAGQTD